MHAHGPDECLALLEDGDPLDLAEQTALRLRQLAILHDVDEVHARVVARVAYEGALLTAPPGARQSESWLRRWIDRSVAELAAEDREEARQGSRAYETWDPRFVFLTKGLGVRPDATRAACVAFNGLGLETRRALFAVTIEGLSVEVSADREGSSVESLLERALTGFGALLDEDKLAGARRPRVESPDLQDARTFIDPEIASVLRGVVARGKSGLLETRDPRNLPGVVGLVDPRGIRHPQVRVAGRHLAHVIRHEVAWLLRQAVVARLFEDSRTGRWLYRCLTARARHRAMPAREILARASRLRSDAESADAFAAELELIQRVASGEEAALLLGECCTASRRLAPGDAALVDVAFEAVACGDSERGESLLQRVLDGDPTDLCASIAHENLGLLHARRDDIRAALSHYRAAAMTSEERPGAVLSWLHAAAQVRDEGEVLRAAGRLDDMVAPEHAILGERCEPVAEVARAMLTNEARAALGRIRDRFGRTSARVMDAYFEGAPGCISAATTVCAVETEPLD